jgi:hypothetical protein
MSWLKVLEEDNVHVIIGLGDKGKEVSIAAYNEISRINMKEKKRRFTLHVVSMKPRPLYFEDLRDVVLNNISLTLTIRYQGFDFEKIGKLVDRIKGENGEVIGIVSSDLEELAKLLEEKGVPVTRV